MYYTYEFHSQSTLSISFPYAKLLLHLNVVFFHYIFYTIKSSHTLFRMKHVIYSHLVFNKGMKRTHYGKGWISYKCWWITAYRREYWSCTLISFCTNINSNRPKHPRKTKLENTREKAQQGHFKIWHQGPQNGRFCQTLDEFRNVSCIELPWPQSCWHQPVKPGTAESC